MVDQGLTSRQHGVLKFIFDYVYQNKRPPTVREIADHFGFKSPRAASDHLRALTSKGYVSSDGNPRGLELNEKVWQMFGIPVYGRIAAGPPDFADAEVLRVVTPDDFYPTGPGYFALEIKGDSMIDRGILEGDTIIFKKVLGTPMHTFVGKVVAAKVDDDHGTCKVLANRHGKYYLDSANERAGYKPLELNGGTVIGRFSRLIRTDRDV